MFACSRTRLLGLPAVAGENFRSSEIHFVSYQPMRRVLPSSRTVSALVVPDAVGRIARRQDAAYGVVPPINTVVAHRSVEYLQSSAKAFAWDPGANDIDLGSHLGAEHVGRISVGWQRIPGPSEIHRNDLALWQGNQGLSEHKAASVDKAPVNEHTIRHASVDQVEPRSLIHG